MSKNKKKEDHLEKIKFDREDDSTKINTLIKDRIYRARDIIIETAISVQLYRKHNIAVVGSIFSLQKPSQIWFQRECLLRKSVWKIMPLV